MLKYREHKLEFADIFRIFISGSSSAGKTYFARQLFENKYIQPERIYYYHPDIQEHFPVDWDQYLSVPICYQSGLPTETDLLNIPRYSCIILDDLFTEACADRKIDYLFRVLSSKRKLHVIIMTQRYFAEGSNGLNIRNSCNYHVLMNNADERTNLRVANMMNSRDSIKKALEINSRKLYPYIFLDKTNQARVSGIQVYTELFGKYLQVVVNSMIFYLISEPDFKANFKSIDSHTAVPNADSPEAKTEIGSENSSSFVQSKEIEDKTSSRACSAPTATDYSFGTSSGYTFEQRRQLERKIKQALRRYQIRSQL